MLTRPLGRQVLRLAAGGAAVVAAAAACSSGSPSSSSTNASSPGSTASNPPATSAPAGQPTGSASGIATVPTADLSPAGTFAKRPTVIVPSGNPPSQLEASDLIVGTGQAAKAGDNVVVQYDGYSWTTKKEFDASWNRGQTFSFPLGRGQVIQGWDQGVPGMKVGGRRELIIPPSLAYGSQTPTPAIAPNDTLIFVVDLVSIGQ